jgi:hypothetical protein
MQKPGNDYNSLAVNIFSIISQHCYFADSVIQTQSKRINKTPATISAADLDVLAPRIGGSVAMFTNPEKGQQVEMAIKDLNTAEGSEALRG